MKKHRTKLCFEEELKRLILEVQHELHMAVTEEEKLFRKKQLSRLLMAVRKHYGSNAKQKEMFGITR